MTKEAKEAIDLLDNLIGMVEDNHNFDYDTALQMGIKALEQEPCEDAISRQAAIDALYHVDEYNGRSVEAIRNLPSVQPEPKSEVLDKIRAEIEQNAYPIVHGVNNREKGMTLYGILQIIDKYKAESEGKE